MNGYFKIHRSLFTSDVWLGGTYEQQSIIMNLLGMACWKETEIVLKSGKKFLLKPGQFVATAQDIVNACNACKSKTITRTTVRRTIERLKSVQFLTTEPTSGLTTDGWLITIVKWGFYQCGDNESDHRFDQQIDHRTTSEQPKSDHPTSIKERVEEGEEVVIGGLPPYNPPTASPEIAQNSCEQDKPASKPKPKRKTKTTEPKKQFAETVWLRQKEYDALVERLGDEEAVKWCIDKLDTYKASKNGSTTYRDDYKAILRWVIDAYHERQERRTFGKPRSPKVQPDLDEVAMEVQRLLDEMG